MALIKVLKLGADGFPLQLNVGSDQIDAFGFEVTAGGTGIDMNNTDLQDVKDVSFNNPAANVINQTAGNLIIDDIMAKERENTLSTAGGIAFPAISDVADEVDALRMPSLAGIPSALPTNGGSGHLLFDDTNDDVYVYTGSAWKNLSSSEAIESNYTSDLVGASLGAAMYVSGSGVVSELGAGDANCKKVVGLSKTFVAGPSNPITLVTSGLFSGLSGLTAGDVYYISSTTGVLTNTAPSASGEHIVKVGVAKSATELEVCLQYLGQVA